MSENGSDHDEFYDAPEAPMTEAEPVPETNPVSDADPVIKYKPTPEALPEADDSSEADPAPFSDPVPEADHEPEAELLPEDEMDTSELPASSEVMTSELPASSSDLQIEPNLLMDALSVYELLQKFGPVLKLSKFQFEEFCSCVVLEGNSTLFTDVHLAFIRAILTEENPESFVNESSKDLLFAYLRNVDELTWSSVLTILLSVHKPEMVQSLHPDYWRSAQADKLTVLLWLMEKFLCLKLSRDQGEEMRTNPITTIGTDSQGRNFWLMARRLVIEKEGDIRYYSNKDKLDELLASYFNPTIPADQQVQDKIKGQYFAIVKEMSVTRTNYVTAYKAFQSMKSPTKFAGKKFGDSSLYSSVVPPDISSFGTPQAPHTPEDHTLARKAGDENFKFGQDMAFKKYKNEYKVADRDTEFSTRVNTRLSTVCTAQPIKWSGLSYPIYDTAQVLKTSISRLVNTLPEHFMHAEWSKRSSAWTTALYKSSSPSHFAASLAFLEAHMRTMIFYPGWQYSTAFTDFAGSKTSLKALSCSSPVPSGLHPGRTKHKVYLQAGEGHRLTPGSHFAWGYVNPDKDFSTPTAKRSNETKVEHLETVLTKMQNKKNPVGSPKKEKIKIADGFKKVVGADGRIMYALPPGAKIMRRPMTYTDKKDMAHVVMSANSLRRGNPTTLKFNEPENKDSVEVKGERNIVLSDQVVKALLKDPNASFPRGNLILKPYRPTPSDSVKSRAKPNTPAKLLETLFTTWSNQDGSQIGPYTVPMRRLLSLARQAGTQQVEGYIYTSTERLWALSTAQNHWRNNLRKAGGLSNVAQLVSVLHSYIRWEDLNLYKHQPQDKYSTKDGCTVERIIVDNRAYSRNPLSSEYKLIIVKSEGRDAAAELGVAKSNNDNLPSTPDMLPFAKLDMEHIEPGTHDIWLDERELTFQELHRYQENQKKLKDIELAKREEEKAKKIETGGESPIKAPFDKGTLLPLWGNKQNDLFNDDAKTYKKDSSRISNEFKSKKYMIENIDPEISSVVRRVLTNILDRVDVEEDREKTKRKRKKVKRGPARSAEEREHIRYLSKLDILLCRRKEQLKRLMLRKRQFLAHQIRQEVADEAHEQRLVEEEERRKEEERETEAQKKKDELVKSENRIKKAQERIEKKLQKLKKNVDDMETKAENRARKESKSPKKSPMKSMKSPKGSKSPRTSIKFDSPKSKQPEKKSHKKKNNPVFVKPVFKSKGSSKTKFKFPAQSNKLKLKSPSRSPARSPLVLKSPHSNHSMTFPRPQVVLKDTQVVTKASPLLKRGSKRGASGPLSQRYRKRPCLQIVPVVLGSRKRKDLEKIMASWLEEHPASDDDKEVTISRKSGKSPKRPKPSKGDINQNNLRERLQKLRKMANAKNRGNEVLTKLLLKQETIRKIAEQATTEGGGEESKKEKEAKDRDQRAKEKEARLTETKPKQGGLKIRNREPLEAPLSSMPGDMERKTVLQHHKGLVSNIKDPNNKKHKDRLYCVCKRPYDATRFYIGCDMCSNWFHGKCVGISPSMARNMPGYTCSECKAGPSDDGPSGSGVQTAEPEAAPVPLPTVSSKPSGPIIREGEPEGDLFCICRTPYNQYSFYIGCDHCQEWYHGTCVGISEMEAERIEVYICDKCKEKEGREEPKLTHIQIAGLIKILRELQMHKMSWPFREPAKESTESKQLIKQPMDLSTIHKKFQKKHYPKMTLFVKDVLRVFSNARQLYAEETQRGRCADTLERYFVAKLNEFKLRHGLT